MITMHGTPDTLENICIQYIQENVVSFLRDSYEIVDSNHHHHDSDNPLLPYTVAEQLLFKLAEHGKLDDGTLCSIFNAHNVVLRHARMPNSSKLTKKGLLALWSHHIQCLEAVGIIHVPLDDLIGCLGLWTLTNLQYLNVSHSKHIWHPFKLSKRKLSIDRLTNLRSLDVSHTKLDNQGLQIIAESVTSLEQLNISCTKVTDISSLCCCRDTLHSLHMFNLRDCEDDTNTLVLSQLEELQTLDMSIETPEPNRRFVSPTRFRVNSLLVQHNHQCLPHLVLLDISGRRDIVTEDLKAFLDYHPKLKFLGLMQTETCHSQMFIDVYREGLKVTGNCSTNQAIEGLLRYIMDRPQFVQDSLNFLFEKSLSQTACQVNILSLILPGIQLHPKKVTLLVAATGCMRNVLQMKIGEVQPEMLGTLAENILVAMENYPKHRQLQENALSILCHDELHEQQVHSSKLCLAFNYKKCARLAMDCFRQFDISDFYQKSLYICFSTSRSMLMKGAQNSIHLQSDEITKMLSIYKMKLEAQIIDDVMVNILKSLCNLTCNSQENGEKFLDAGGLELFFKTLQKFPERVDLTYYLLPTTHSIALFRQLRPYLATDQFINEFRQYLKRDDFLIAYHMCGILSLLTMDKNEPWQADSIQREEVLEEVFERLQRLTPPEQLPFHLRSFSPGYPMLSCQIPYQAQTWILYSMYHFCRVEPERYCSMIANDNGLALIQGLLHNKHNSHPVIQQFCGDICKMVWKQGYIPLTGNT